MEPTLKDGEVLVNGQKKQNPELTKPTKTSAVFSLSPGTGEHFALGENRGHSFDSRNRIFETATKKFWQVALCYWRQLTLSNGRNSYEIKAWLRAQQIRNEKRMADCSDRLLLLRYARCGN
jgi:hypothetical protein